MPVLNTYLTFKDNCEEAFNFYHSVFGGPALEFMRFSTIPDDVPAEYKPKPEEANKVMHVAYPIGHSILMGSDSQASFPAPVVGNNFSVSVSVDSEAEADRVFAGLTKGGEVTMPLGKTFWGSYFGMLKDQFDIQWMVSYDYPQQ